MLLFGKNKKENLDEMKKDKEGKFDEKNKVRILGSGCAKCVDLEKTTKRAISELNLDFLELSHVEDFVEIMKYGVMSTPALVLDGKVVSYGKKLSLAEVKKFLRDIYKI
ncbi:MAG: thioredoxin family protein [Fusobacteriales bacterium]|nr:MAG: thioredoxin family protein [Fusobacteriales bacterium]